MNNIEIYVFRDNGIWLNNCLLGQRLERYKEATRKETKRQLIFGSHVIYKVLKLKGITDNIAYQSFCTSSHNIKNLPFYISFSHTNEYYVIAVCSDPLGVDAEIYQTREERVYDKYIKNKEIYNLEEKKKIFYKNWLTKEAVLKCSEYTKPDTYFVQLINLVIGVCSKRVEKVSIFLLNI